MTFHLTWKRFLGKGNGDCIINVLSLVFLWALTVSMLITLESAKEGFGRQGFVSTAHLQFCLCSFQVVYARLLIFFPIKEHELEALNLVCPFCHTLLKCTFREAFAASLQTSPWQPLSFSVCLSVYVSYCMSTDLSKRRLEHVCLWGF